MEIDLADKSMTPLTDISPSPSLEGTPERFRADARAWLAEHRRLAPRDYGPILPPGLAAEGRAWQGLLYEAGFAGIHWPTGVGGRGLSPEHQGIWLEECALAEVPPVLNMVGLVLTAGAILAFGTPEQQASHLPPTLTGERIWCQLFSEPGAGSDLASLATRAVRDGDEYVLDGQKVWCSNGRVSDWGICMARTRTLDEAPKHKGISFFLLDMKSPGIEIRPLRQMNGEAEFDEVFFTGVRVPAANLLGPEHEGWKVAMATLTNERGHIGASIVGLQRRLDAIAALGAAAPGGLGPVQRDRIVRLWCRGQALMALVRRQGPIATVAASLLKLGVTELAFDSAVLRADLAGAAAMLDGDASRGLLGAPGARLGGGTTQIQQTIVGERLLGLPKEPS